jgi:hypothetical protein
VILELPSEAGPFGAKGVAALAGEAAGTAARAA